MAKYLGRDVIVVETLTDNPEKVVYTVKGDDVTKYTVDLADVELSDEEEKALQDKLTKAVEDKKKARQARKAARKAARIAWVPSQTYAKDAKVSYDDGFFYSSTEDGNVGNTPSKESKKWTRGGDIATTAAPVEKHV